MAMESMTRGTTWFTVWTLILATSLSASTCWKGGLIVGRVTGRRSTPLGRQVAGADRQRRSVELMDTENAYERRRQPYAALPAGASVSHPAHPVARSTASAPYTAPPQPRDVKNSSTLCS